MVSLSGYLNIQNNKKWSSEKLPCCSWSGFAQFDDHSMVCN